LLPSADQEFGAYSPPVHLIHVAKRGWTGKSSHRQVPLDCNAGAQAVVPSPNLDHDLLPVRESHAENARQIPTLEQHRHDRASERRLAPPPQALV